MKKLLLSVLFLGLIAVVAVVPYWFGVEVERIFERQMTLLDSNNKISVVDSRFRRGWMRSVAETTFAVRDYQSTVLAVHTIDHGPFPISNPVRYLLALQPLQALIHSELSIPGAGASGAELPVGTLSTTVNIDSTTKTRIEIPAADAQLEDAATMAWKRIQGSVDFEPSNASWQGTMDLGGIDWSRHDYSFSLGKSTLTFLTYPGRTGLAMGNSTLVTESLRARIPDSEHLFESKNLVITSTAAEQGQNVEYKMSGEFASALLPTLELTGATWHLSAHDLDLDTLTDLNDLGVDSAIPLNKVLALVSKRNARLDSGLTLQTDSGPLAATARVKLAGDGNSSNPLALIGALDGDIQLEVPAAVAELAALTAVKKELSDLDPGGQEQPMSAQDEEALMHQAVPARIQSWLDGNLLTREGDRYRFQASIREGSVSLNGKPFNLPSLLR